MKLNETNVQTPDSNIILDIQNLSCGYGSKPVIENFNLQVRQGDCIAITGPNGCGKSTLLKAIYQLCEINNGRIYYKGKDLNGKTPEELKNSGIAFFMQKNAIFAKLSVRENLLLSLNGNNIKNKNLKIEEMTTLFPEIGNWLRKTAGLLSGGQRQQLAMAMLLVQDADLWLLDEPTAGLDNEKSEYFVELILHHSGKTSDNPKTIIIIEHKGNTINQLAKQIIKL